MHYLFFSLLPKEGHPPKLCQLYIYDTDHESQNRIAILNRQRNSGGMDEDVIMELQVMIHQFNPYAQVFQTVHNLYGATPPPERTMRITDTRASDWRQYNRPTANEVAAIMVGQGAIEGSHHDTVSFTTGGQLQRINETHPSYMALQYPLLFSYGEDGWRINISHNLESLGPVWHHS